MLVQAHSPIQNRNFINNYFIRTASSVLLRGLLEQTAHKSVLGKQVYVSLEGLLRLGVLSQPDEAHRQHLVQDRREGIERHSVCEHARGFFHTAKTLESVGEVCVNRVGAKPEL